MTDYTDLIRRLNAAAEDMRRGVNSPAHIALMLEAEVAIEKLEIGLWEALRELYSLKGKEHMPPSAFEIFLLCNKNTSSLSSAKVTVTINAEEKN